MFTLPEGITWRLEMLRRYWYFVRTFRNGVALAWNYRRRVPSDRAVCWDGTTVRHPAGRVGLAQTILELWLDEAYTRGFYRPNRGDVIVDAGANIGLFSIWMARQRPGCRIVAFEPFAENFKLLMENLHSARVSGVEAHMAGLGGKTGLASIAASARSLDHQLVTGAVEGADGASIRVYSFADALALVNARKIAFFKIDIEGSEYELFAGAAEADLRRVARFAIEYHEHLRPGVLDLLRERLSGTHHVEVHTDHPGVYGLLLAREKAP